MKTIDGIGRPRSQPPRLMSERERYTLARAFYCDLRDDQNLPAEQRKWSDVDAMRILLALFPELVVDHGIALEFFEFEEGEQPTHTPPNDNIIYLR